MRKLVLFCLIVTYSAVTFAQQSAVQPAKVLVVYYSAKGHTKALAEAVAKGAGQVEGAKVELKAIPDAKAGDILAADAVIVGSPVYKGNVAPQVQEFINSWPIQDKSLHDKLGAAFATASGISAGEELTQLNILHSMLICQMIVVGGPGAGQPFGASAVSETPGDKPKDNTLVPEYYLKKGEALGKRVAELAVRMKIQNPKSKPQN